MTALPELKEPEPDAAPSTPAGLEPDGELAARLDMTRQRIINKTSKSFGLLVRDKETGADRVNNLIVLHSDVPTSVTRPYATYDEWQDSAMLRCMENKDSTGPESNIPPATSKELGCIELRFTRALPKGSPLEVTIALTADEGIKLHGRDLTTHQQVDATWKTDAVYSVEEVLKMKSRNMAIAVS